MTGIIRNASDALAALDSLVMLEATYDGAIPQAARQQALADVATAQAWIAAHPQETAAERAARREAMQASITADFDNDWARTLRYRAPDAAMKARICR